MDIRISIHEDDARLVRSWLDYQINKEAFNEASPRNHVLLFCSLIKEAIDEQND